MSNVEVMVWLCHDYYQKFAVAVAFTWIFNIPCSLFDIRLFKVSSSALCLPGIQIHNGSPTILPLTEPHYHRGSPLQKVSP